MVAVSHGHVWIGLARGIAAAAPERTDAVPHGELLAASLVVLVVVAAAPYCLRRTRGGALLVASAGAADATAVLTAKLISNALAAGRVLLSLGLAAAAGATVL